MSKQKIREWLEKQNQLWLEIASKADIIHQYTQDPRGWVSVDDRLPNGSYAHVLVYCDGGHVDRTFYCTDRNFLASSRDAGSYSRKRHGKNSGYFELSHKFGYKITHWMPLPEPPK